MNPHVTLNGDLVIGLPPQSALQLFTPEGERGWVPGWAPRYPAGRPSQPDPGTVFITGDSDASTTWIVLDRSDTSMRYARVATGRTAGTVTVTCEPAATAEATRVHVRYELTALETDGALDIAELAADYPGFLAGWRQAIEHAGLASSTR
jgi:hypothetical protein